MTPNIFSVSVLNGTVFSVFEVFDTSSAYAMVFPFCKDEDVSISDLHHVDTSYHVYQISLMLGVCPGAGLPRLSTFAFALITPMRRF
jgi:hypothetical protein